MFYSAIIFYKYLFVNLLFRIMSLIKIMKVIYMEPLKSLTFKYNAFTPTFRRRAVVSTTLLVVMFWILVCCIDDGWDSIFFFVVFMVMRITDFIISIIHLPIGIPLVYVLLIYILIVLPPQLLLFFLNLYDKSGKVDFYENYVILTCDTKEIILNKNDTVINLVIINKKNLFCTIKTSATNVTFSSSKTENKQHNISYKQLSLYYVMREVMDFLCLEIEEEL